GGVLAARGDGNKEAFEVLAIFQGLAMIMEGTYTMSDGKEPPKRKAAVPFTPRKRSVYSPPSNSGAMIGAATGNVGTGAAVGGAVGGTTGGLVGNGQAPPAIPTAPTTLPPAENR